MQRIAICYGIAARDLPVLERPRTQAILFAAILLGYWALLMFVPAPETGKAGDFAKETNLAGYLDRHYLPGKIYQAYYGYGDNEGLLSTIPAVATALLGVLAGQWLLSDRSPWAKAVGLIAGGRRLPGRWATLWGLRVSRSSRSSGPARYVLVAGGWSLLLLALFYAIIDV